MPTRNINLTPEMKREDNVKLEALRAAVHAGEESGIAEGDVMGEVRELIRRSSRLPHLA